MTADEIAQLLSTPDAFKAWIDQMPDDYEVGITDSCGKCPIAAFLLHAGAARPQVMLNSVMESADSVHLPIWAQAFIRKVDRTFLDQWGNVASRLVTAGRCKEVLHELEAAP